MRVSCVVFWWGVASSPPGKPFRGIDQVSGDRVSLGGPRSLVSGILLMFLGLSLCKYVARATGPIANRLFLK